MLARADAAGRQRDRARRGSRGRARREDARRAAERLQAAEGDAQPEPGADLSRRRRRGAGAPVQRDAASASAGAGSIGDRRDPRGAQAHGARCAGSPITSSTRRAMTVHELRHAFRDVEAGRAPGSQLVVTILSFGFKHGIPVDSDLLFDVRFLPNPHFVPEAATAHGPRPRGASVPRQVAGHARVPRAHAEPAAVSHPAIRGGREDLPDGGHRLHRRTASIGGDCRGAEERPGRHCRRPTARAGIGTLRSNDGVGELRAFGEPQ